MKRITRDRRLTPEEAAKYRAIRTQVARELPEIIARHHERMNRRSRDYRSMSHTQQFWLFEDGEPKLFPLKPLITVLQRHGCTVHSEVDGLCWVETPINEQGNADIASDGGIGVRDGSASSFSVDRPYYDDEFFALAGDLVCELGLCMFSEAGTGTYIRDASQQKHIPQSISTNATVIRSAEDLKTAMMSDDVSPEGT